MPTPVWVYPYEYPLKFKREFDEVRLPMGSGSDIVVSRDVAFTHATGYRGTASYAGVNLYTISLRVPLASPFPAWADVCAFLQSRKDNNEAFYFYNANENSVTSTWTGDSASGPTNDLDGLACTNTTGRYLVRLFGGWEATVRYGRLVEIQLTLEEVTA